jgi:hypothetical protein
VHVTVGKEYLINALDFVAVTIDRHQNTTTEKKNPRCDGDRDAALRKSMKCGEGSRVR